MKTLSNRQSIRLKNWDYRVPAYYFVTICTYGRENFFENEQFKEIAISGLLNLPTKKCTQHIVLDEWVVMPNHIHAIFIFTQSLDEITPLISQNKLKNAPKGSLGVAVAKYKNFVTNRINCLRRVAGGKIWQRGYYEHIIRGESEWRSIQQYITNNPLRWAEDRDNLDTLITKMNLKS